MFLASAPLDRLEPEAASGKVPGKMASAFSLDSGRGKRVDVWGACSRCGFSCQPRWYYARSTHGAVHLCVPCKQAGLDAREGVKSQDALDLPPGLLASGAFESKRRQH